MPLNLQLHYTPRNVIEFSIPSSFLLEFILGRLSYLVHNYHSTRRAVFVLASPSALCPPLKLHSPKSRSQLRPFLPVEFRSSRPHFDLHLMPQIPSFRILGQQRNLISRNQLTREAKRGTRPHNR